MLLIILFIKRSSEYRILIILHVLGNFQISRSLSILEQPVIFNTSRNVPRLLKYVTCLKFK